MNSRSIFNEMEDDIMHALPMDRIDRNIKSLNQRANEESRALINSAVNRVVLKKLESMTSNDLNDLAEYAESKRENFLNVMKSTCYEDGLVCAISLIDVVLADFISDKAKSRQKEANVQAHEKESKPKVEEPVKPVKKQSLLKKIKEKLFGHHKEMGEE